MTFINCCRVVHKLLPWVLQTFAALFTNFCHDFHKLLSRCLQTFAMTFTDFCRVVQKLLLLFFLVVHKLSEVMFTETFAMRAFVAMLL